jgi:hypothetical protein
MFPSATSPPVSPEFDRSKGKPNITKSNLKEHGIEYDPAILGCRAADGTANGGLPPYVNGVRELLSDFTGVTVHQDLEGSLQHDLSEAMKQGDFAEIIEQDSWSLSPSKYWTSAFPNQNDKFLQETDAKRMEECRDIAEEAISLREASEAEWTLFIRTNLFLKHKSTKKTRKTVE